MLPAEACSVEMFQNMHADIREIKTALVGSKLSGPGLIQRVGEVEKTVENHDRKIWFFSSLSAGLGFIAPSILSWFKK